MPKGVPKNKSTEGWPENTISRLRTLWAEGHSTAEIGRRLGVSKNSIAGKAHRLELEARPSPILPKKQAILTGKKVVQTLPALSDVPPAPVVDVLSPPTPEVEAVPAVSVVETKATLQPAVSAPPRAAPAQVELEPAPPPAAPVQPAPKVFAPLPRLAPIPARPYGRVITCCWPIGEVGTKSFHFCDSPSEPGKPYCGEHTKIAYIKVRDRREDAA